MTKPPEFQEVSIGTDEKEFWEIPASPLKRVTVPLFEISSTPKISIADFKRQIFGSTLPLLPCELDWEYDDVAKY